MDSKAKPRGFPAGLAGTAYAVSVVATAAIIFMQRTMISGDSDNRVDLWRASAVALNGGFLLTNGLALALMLGYSIGAGIVRLPRQSAENAVFFGLVCGICINVLVGKWLLR